MKNRKRKMRILEERIALAAKKAEERKATKSTLKSKASSQESQDVSPPKKVKMAKEKNRVTSSSEMSKHPKFVKGGRHKQHKQRKDRRDPGPGCRSNLSSREIQKREKTTFSDKKGHQQMGRTQKNDNSDIWFDGVDPVLITASRQDQSRTYSLFKASSFSGPTRHVAIDCEFVGVGYQGKDSVLARVSIVNQFGHVLIDKFVQPKEKVTDYRTRFSGVRPRDLVYAEPFEKVHAEVAKLLDGRVVVGHSLRGDLKVLFLSHPRHMVRDTSRYRPFRELVGNRTPSLKRLTNTILGITIQEGEHDSVIDARAAMCLYLSRKVEWEASLRRGRRK